ncbi:MAG: NAD(+)/NADH kinase [Haloplanus sp.]
MARPRVGLIVNPAAGRDVRRLTGSAVVTDSYTKRRVAGAVVEGLTMVDAPVELVVMPDPAGIGETVLERAPEAVPCRLLDMDTEGSARDTRRAADRFRGASAPVDTVDAVVVLGGDGTTRDVAQSVGDVPVGAVSTGTNNVVPSFVDGAVAGAAAGVVATGAVPPADVCVRHGMVEATVVDPARDRERTVRGLVTVGVVDRAFVGTRAVLHGSEFVGGVVSHASPGDIGLSGIVGAVRSHAPETPGGVAVRLAPVDDAPRCVRAITLPGVVERLGVADCTALDDGEAVVFEVAQGVVSADGERELEVTDGVVRIHPVDDGPRLLSFEETMAQAARDGCFVDG